jgi:transcriptional regulator with XRE-family HTH domain
MARQPEQGADFARWLVRAQRAHRLTTEELSRQSGVSLRLLQKYRSGEVRWPRGQNRDRIEAVLGEGPPAPDPFDDPDPLPAAA